MNTQKLCRIEQRMIGSWMMVCALWFLCFERYFTSYSFSFLVGEGYVEDGREIFDDVEDEYEKQPNSNKRKSQQKRKGKLPDEPAPKKKSLKNFFNTKDTKEKEAASVNDDDLLKNMLGELEGNGSGSADSPVIKPLITKSIRKQATASEIEVKNYMERFEKKIQKPSRTEVNDVS
jgi:hypothetical protein